MRTLFLAVLCMASVCAQNLRLSNLSTEPQWGWVSVTVPVAPAESMSFMPYGWPAVAGRQIGTHGRQVFVLARIPGKGHLEGTLKARPLKVPRFTRSNWFTGPDLIPGLSVTIGSVDHRPTVNVIGMLESNSARQVWQLRSTPVEGVVFDAWAYVYSFQDRVDWEWSVTWSDRDDAALSKPRVSVRLKWRHPMRVNFRNRIDVSTNGDWMTLLIAREMGDAETFAYSGSMLCQGKPGTNAIWDMIRVANLEASKKGPMRGVCLDWDGNWLAFGQVPEKPNQFRSADVVHASFLESMSRGGGYFDERPLASRKRTGSTGAQADFGASRGEYAVTLGDPRRIYELEYSVTSCLRGFHHKNSDGSPLRHAQHSNWQTWSQYSDHRLGGDMLGKPSAYRPWAQRFGVSGFSGWDDQHRSQNYEIALYALRPTYMLEQAFMDGIEADLAQMNPVRSGAPRAQGRLLMCWSNWYLLLDGDDRKKVRANMDRRLRNAVRDWSGKGRGVNQVRVIEENVRDDRVLGKATPAWMPWQESIACMGYFAGWRVTDDKAYRDMALTLAVSVTRWAFFQDAQGDWHVCTGVASLPDGEPLPAAAYDEQSGKVKISNSFAAWTVPACAILLELEPNSPHAARARAIMGHFFGDGYSSWSDSAWMAVSSN